MTSDVYEQKCLHKLLEEVECDETNVPYDCESDPVEFDHKESEIHKG